MKHFSAVALLFFGVHSMCLAQNKYWLFFNKRDFSKDPQISVKTQDSRRKLNLPAIQNSDYALSEDILEQLRNAKIKIIQKSKWLNAVSIDVSDLEKAKHIKGLLSFQKIKTFEVVLRNKIEDYDLTTALKQIHADVLVRRRLFGDDIDVGVIDGGFYNAHKFSSLQNLFKNNQIKNVKDFVSPNRKDFFGTKESNSDFHGTLVLASIAGFDSLLNQYQGLASNSNFYLARTESGNKESRIEEDNYLAAIEWMDSLGVRLINSSLGYAQGFTNPSENYMPENMDGKTSVIAKAAQIAVNEKGMILVVSAGNEGENKSWGGVVGTPADVENVITVGANDELGQKMNYSSKGVDFVGFIKPDITIYSQVGTSLAAPIVTGLIATLMQLKPEITNFEVKSILQKSGIIYPYNNNFVGVGYPDAEKCLSILDKQTFNSTSQQVKAKRSYKIAANQSLPLVAFHKKDQNHVLFQELIPANQVVLNRPDNVNFTTLKFEDKTIEIKWK